MDYDENDSLYNAQSSQEQEDQESETQPTQSTQQASQASQDQTVNVDAHLWGYLLPCSASLTRIDFWRVHPTYCIGRNSNLNQVVLPGFKVSNQHCTIKWDGQEGIHSTVTVLDLSSNGTFVNGEKLGKNQTRILRDGNEIAFGTAVPQSHNGGLEDYRFIYRHTASGPPTDGLYAHYDVGTELGKGSFATVRKAVHRGTGRFFAVKMIHSSKAVRSSGQSSRSNLFAREISIMEKLEHPNICCLVEVFFQNDDNLVLELVEGGDLLEHILKTGGLSEVNARDITYQLCDAMAYIHSKGVTHRDLKPENVLLTKDNPPRVKVADFGLAKIVDSMTMLRTMCGTPSYLAPEVVRQEHTQEGYDNLVDSWSVGVIVFSMISNSSPFIEDDRLDIKRRILTRRVDWHTLMNCDISEEAILFIRGLLEEDPRMRMSLTQALRHIWLRQHLPFHGYSSDASMYEQDEEYSQEDLPAIEAVPGPSGSQPLQRRSMVLSVAAEAGNNLPEPSWEMLSYAAAHNDSQPSNNVAVAGKGQKKRVRADLTPLPEESLDTPAANENLHNTSNDGSESRPRRSTRRSNKAARVD
ncbi:Pkinase-domain-containing protein [Agrocybe pediades]|nr:Pkinase-domain-containing protein [Agrocybe pediades]